METQSGDIMKDKVLTEDVVTSENNRINEGDLLLLSSFGAGFTWGSILIRWKSYD